MCTHYKLGLLVSILLLVSPSTGIADDSISGPAVGAQCQFTDRTKAIVVKPDGANTYTILIRHTDGRSDLSTLKIFADGHKELETNGGITKQLAIDRVFHELQRRGLAPIPAGKFEAFLAQEKVKECPWPSLYWHLWRHGK